MMAIKIGHSKKVHQRRQEMKDNGMSGGVYGLAFLGALVYYVQHAVSFWAGVLGVFKAILWPAMLTYKVLELLKM